MNGAADGAGNGAMTLVFELTAVEALENPREVFADARRWSRYVGVVADDPDAVASYLAEHDLDQDFDPDGSDKWMSLVGIREAVATDRYVFVGTNPDDRHLTAYAGWEFVSLAEAAEKAGWTLAQADDETGVVARLREFLSRGRRG